MRNLASLPFKLLLLCLLGLCMLAAATPPIYEAVFGQVRRSDGIHIGAPNVDVIVDGNIKWTSPDGGSSHNPSSGLTLTKPVTCGAAAACGTATLSSGTPSTATVTVPAGVTCSCFPVGTTTAIAAGGCAANVSATTLTLTGPNTVTTAMRYICWL